MRDNSVAVIVLGILGFVAIIITGKWLLDKKEIQQQQVQQQQQFQQQAQVQPIIQVQPGVPQPAPQTQIVIGQPYPRSYPQYHSRNEFWQGYSDGWNGFFRKQSCPEYIQGYEIGQHDRRCNQPYYHEHYCPPGFSLRVPGFSLNIR